MDKRERTWLIVLVAVALTVNVVTLTPLVPWQEWLLWSKPAPAQRFNITIADYQFQMPPKMEIKAGEYVEFTATSGDVTYGFGVFRQDGTMVFQMQVVPGHENSIIWKFDTPGTYDVRSTEYSGPHHPEMFVESAIRVIP